VEVKQEMKFKRLAAMVAMCSLSFLAAAAAPLELNAMHVLTIRVSNVSTATARDEADMEESASRVFRHSGIEVAWAACPPAPAPCQEIAAPAGHTTVLIRLMDVPAQPKRKLLGRADHVNSSATVFYKRACAMEQDSKWVVTRGQILGHAIAHEVGHLLLASDEHSLFGIMKAEYGLKDLVTLGQENLFFTAQEGRLLRNALHMP
jgi:hypothetical protein